MTMTLISTTTLASTAASITFSAIPQTYTDLVVLLSGRTGSGNVAYDAYIQFNASTTSYSERWLIGDGSGVAQPSNTLLYFRTNGGTSTANTFGNTQFYIPNYTGSNNKSLSIDFVTENNATTVSTGIGAAVWANTAAITSITLNGDGQLWSIGTTASLYGITKGSGGATVSP